MSISLVAGLGNPGREYERSRHNLGWVAVDAYASRHGLAWRDAPDFESIVARRDLGPGRTLWLAKPQTFMNESGRAVAALARYHRIGPGDVAAVYDDLTIDLGLVKVTYQAGYNTIPIEVQYQVAQLVKWKLELGVQELLLEEEKGGEYEYKLTMEMVANMPKPVRQAAGKFKLHYA